ncbi:18478_t:CDS:1, partial [Racocetra persica]
AVAIYIQVVDKSIAMKEVLDDEEIITTVQADKNEEELTEQEIENEDEVSDSPVTTAKVCNTIQTIIRYEEQENSESNFTLKKLGFLRKLLKEYKLIYEKSKKQSKITSFFNFQDSCFHDSSPYDSFPHDSYSENLYSQDHSQNSYFQYSYLQDSYPQDWYLHDSLASYS